MEQNDGQNDFYDLSRVLDDVEPKPTKKRLGKITVEGDIPGIYRMVFRLSGGIIRTEGKARIIIIVFLIIINTVTYMIASGRNGII
jgi:hypothetical protein